MADNLRISMVQSHIIWEDRDENLGYYGELLRRVSGKTDIAVLPETFTTGFYGCGKAGRHDGRAYYPYYKGVGEEI